MILQKFSYPLGATCFTDKECNSIQAKYMPTVLSKMGINRLTPTDVRFGPSLYAGMTVTELWPLQGTTKNKLLIGHLRKCDIVGKNLSQTWLFTTASRSIVGCIKLGGNYDPKICWQMLGIAPLGVQWQIWTNCNMRRQGMVAPAMQTWPVHYGSSHKPSSSHLKKTARSTMLLSLPPSYDISWHYQQCWNQTVWMGNKPKILPTIPTMSYPHLSQPS
jgi:hypothetical protein